MHDFYNDIYMKFDYDPQNNKFAFEKNVIGPEEWIVIDLVDYTYTDDNSIFVNDSLGSDTNPGTQALPKKTLLASANACTSTKTKVVALFNEEYNEELDTIDNSNFAGFYGKFSNAKYTKRVLDYTPSDANSIFVAKTGNDTTGNGTESLPYLTIGHAGSQCDVTHQAVVINDVNASQTYVEEGFSMTGNFKKLVARIGFAPDIQLHANPSFVDSMSTKKAISEFTGNSITGASCGVFSDDNFVVAYYDSISTESYFSIYDSDGTLITGPTSFHTQGTVTVNSCTVLENQNFVIIYADALDANAGEFVIYDSSGTIVKSSTEFDSGSVAYFAVIGLSDSSFVIAYVDTGDNKAYFTIYDSTGTVTKAKTEFDSGVASYIRVKSMSNDNFVIMYNGSGGNEYQIFDSTGTQVKAATSVGYQNQHYDMDIDSNDNIIMAGRTAVPDGRYRVLDSDGTILTSGNIWTANDPNDIRVNAMSNGAFVISYSDADDGDKGKFTIIDQLYNQIVTATEFEAGAIQDLSSCMQSTNDFVFTYMDDDDGDKGKFVIYDSYRYDCIQIDADAIINGVSIKCYDENFCYRMLYVNGTDLDLFWTELKNAENVNRGNDAYAVYSNHEVNASNCTIHDSDQGIYCESTAAIFEDCLFYRCNKTGYALHIKGAAAGSGDITVEHVTFFANNSAMRFENNNGANETIINNIIHDNSIYGINADVAVTFSYSINTDVLNNATAGTSVVAANPLFVNEGALIEADTDLNLKKRVLGYPVDSPGYLLANDTNPDRDGGAHNSTPIGDVESWTSFSVEKPGGGFKVVHKAVGKTKTDRKDGSIASTYEAWQEEVTINFGEGIRNADYDNIMLMLNSGNDEIRFYPDSVTNPSNFNVYFLIYDNVNASADHYKLTETGRQNLRIKFARAYSP